MSLSLCGLIWPCCYGIFVSRSDQQCHLNVLPGTHKCHNTINTRSLDLTLMLLWTGYCSTNECCNLAVQLFLYDRTLSLHCCLLHLYSSQNLDTFCMSCIAALLLLWRGYEQLYTLLLWA